MYREKGPTEHGDEGYRDDDQCSEVEAGLPSPDHLLAVRLSLQLLLLPRVVVAHDGAVVEVVGCAEVGAALEIFPIIPSQLPPPPSAYQRWAEVGVL